MILKDLIKKQNELLIDNFNGGSPKDANEWHFQGETILEEFQKINKRFSFRKKDRSEWRLSIGEAHLSFKMRRKEYGTKGSYNYYKHFIPISFELLDNGGEKEYYEKILATEVDVLAQDLVEKMVKTETAKFNREQENFDEFISLLKEHNLTMKQFDDLKYKHRKLTWEQEKMLKDMKL